MNKIKNNKVTYLAAAVLATASLFTANTTVKADAVNTNKTDNNAVKTTADDKLTQADLDSAKSNAENLQKQADQKQKDYNALKQDNQKASTEIANKAQQAEQDVKTAKDTVNAAKSDYQNNVTANEQNDTAIANNQKQTTETNTAVKQNQTDLANNQTQTQAAQAKLAQDQAQVKQNHQNAPTQAEIKQAQDKVAKETKDTTNDMQVPDSYKQAVKKYDGLANEAYDESMKTDHDILIAQSSRDNTWYKNKASYDQDMYKASREAVENTKNDYVHNKEDEAHQVDLDHITTDEYQEINEYATRLINSVRNQVGRPNVVLNGDVMKMAQMVANGYNEDGRSNLDGKGHDFKAVNDASRQYGLFNDPNNRAQYYEDMSGWPTNTTVYISHDKMALDNDNWFGWYINDDKTIKHTVSMDYIKQNIYTDLADMFFNNKEWDHAKSLMNIGDMNYDHETKHYAFGMSISVLPNTNEVSTHYLIVPDSDYIYTTDPKVTPISNKADQKVTSLSDLRSQLKEDQAKLDEMENAEKGISQADSEMLKNDQLAIDKLTDEAKKLNETKTSLTTKLQDLATEKQNLLQRKQDLANAIKDSQAKLQAAEADLTAKENIVKNLDQKLPHTQAELDAAQKAAQEAQDKADKAKHAYDEAVKAYNAEQALENQHKGQTDDNHKTDPAQPDEGAKTDNPTKGETDHTKTDENQTEHEDKHENVSSNHDDHTSFNQTDLDNTTPNGDLADLANNASQSSAKTDTQKPAETAKTNTVKTNTVKTTIKTAKNTKRAVLSKKHHAYYLRNGKTLLKFKNYKQAVYYILKHKVSNEVRVNESFKLAKNARLYTKNGKRTLHLVKRGTKLQISEFVTIKGHLYAHLAHSKFYIRATRLF